MLGKSCSDILGEKKDEKEVPWYYFIPAVLLIIFLFVGPMFA